MPYVQTSWVNATTPVNATNMNHLETQYLEATLSIEPLLLTACVFNGLAATKDATTANQLDVAAGNAFLLQADNTLRQRGPGAQQTFTTSVINTTYNLYIQPDGTFYWSTSNAPAANSLAIATVTTDGSGNIVTVTDKRPTASTLFNGMLGTLTMPPMSVIATTTPAQLGTPVVGVTFGGASPLSGDSSAGSASFNGTTGAVSIPTSGLASGNGAWTALSLVNLPSTPAATAGMIGWGTAATNQAVEFGFTSAGKPYCGFQAGSFLAGPNTLSNSAWHLVVGTYDGTNLRVYVDGTLVAGPTAATAGAVALANAYLGRLVPANNINASLAEAAIWNSALSAANVTALWNAVTAGGFRALLQSLSPLVYYRLNEPSGASWANSFVPSTVQTVAPDASANLGRVASLGGQTSAGILGAPVIIAQAVHVHVTATTVQTILTISAPATALYRVSGYIYLNNGTQPQSITFGPQFTDPDAGVQNGADIITQRELSTGGFTVPTTAGANSPYNNGIIACAPYVFYAKAGTNINVVYQDPANTPNDFVSALLERLT